MSGGYTAWKAAGYKWAEERQFSAEQSTRYSRHFMLPEVGENGQAKLLDAKVLMVGAGGLGSPSAYYLAAAGVGTMGIIDDDVVDLSNLQRQILHTQDRIGQPKTESAKQTIQALNPDVRVITYQEKLTSKNIMDIIKDYDIVVDGCDNFPTRYLINDACVMAKKPNVHGSIFQFEGQASVFDPGNGPCYRCLYPQPPPAEMAPNCQEAGVLGVLPGLIGVIQAIETIKIILGKGDTLAGRLLCFNTLTMEITTLNLKADPSCPVCGEKPSIDHLIDYEEFCGVAPPTVRPEKEVSVSEFFGELRGRDDVLLLDVREPLEWNICRIEGAVLIPLGQLPSRLSELDPSKLVVTQCHTGIRSYRALEVLEAAGFSRVRNLRGGIEAWAVEVEPEMPRY
jgi:adenylyltransferase/sulfurtransferase